MNNVEQREHNISLLSNALVGMPLSVSEAIVAGNFVEYNGTPCIRVNTGSYPYLLLTSHNKYISYYELGTKPVKIIQHPTRKTIAMDTAITTFMLSQEAKPLVTALASLIGAISSLSEEEIMIEAFKGATIILRSINVTQRAVFGVNKDGSLFILQGKVALRYKPHELDLYCQEVSRADFLADADTYDIMNVDVVTGVLIKEWVRIHNLVPSEYYSSPAIVRFSDHGICQDMLDLVVMYIRGDHFERNKMEPLDKDPIRYVLKNGKPFAINNKMRFNGKVAKEITEDWLNKATETNSLTLIIDVFNVARAPVFALYGYLQQLIRNNAIDMSYNEALMTCSYFGTGEQWAYTVDGVHMYRLSNDFLKHLYTVDEYGTLTCHVVDDYEDIEPVGVISSVACNAGDLLRARLKDSTAEVGTYNLPKDIVRAISVAAF